MEGLADALKAGERYRLTGRFREAERAYRAAHVADPGHGAAAAGLAEACRRQGRKDEALDVVLRVLLHAPMSVDLILELGRLLNESAELEGAIACYERAAELDPAHAEARRMLAGAKARRRGSPSSGQLSDRLSPAGQLMFARALSRLGRFGDAVPLYRGALARDPQNAQVRDELVRALFEVGQIDEEVETSLQAAAANNPTSAIAQFRLGHAWVLGGRLPEAVEAFKKAHELDPRDPFYQSKVVFTLTLLGDAKSALEEAKRYSDCYEPADFTSPANVPRSPRSGDRLRVGYVSPDFCQHVDSFFLLPLFRHHNRAHVEVFCYSATRHPDEATAMLTQYADRWVPILGLSDEQAAARIRDDGIDILVDLKLHCSEPQLGIFARRPAPVQACWLSYPGTTGLRAMDFRLTDPYLDPPGSHADHYTETSIRLADTFWCYERPGASPEVGPPPMLARGYVTFGSLNRVRKVSDEALALWASLLRRVDNAKILLHAQRGSGAVRIVRTLASLGVALDRIKLIDMQKTYSYLNTYNDIDVVLDTYPCNGATTTVDGLLMGVPFVTLVGPTAVGRAGLSLATNLGLPELVATTPEEYVEIAVRLASDPARLTALRESMRERLQASPLMDGPRFAASVEAAYRVMWREKVGV
jgi:predicted O-linked N-acetylglucosamine transferase (SPINDLY family)